MCILNVCDVPNVMEVLRIVNIIITIIRVVVPILLIVSAMIDLVRAVNNSELNKISKPIVNKAIAAVVVFLIPTFVSVLAGFVGNDGEYKHCIKNISAEQIKIAYSEFERDLVDKAEESFSIYDYNNALMYLDNIKDLDERKEFKEKLDTIKEQIDAISKAKLASSQPGYPTQTYGAIECSEKKNGGTTYALCIPKEYNNQKIPMIVWLHGAGERNASYSTLINSGMIKVVRNWSSTGLKDIPAIIVAPISDGWSSDSISNKVRAIMEEVMTKYSINKNNVSLIGHSMGGSGVYSIASKNQSYFSSVVMLSGYVSSPESKYMDYFKNIPMKGYSEGGSAWNYTSSFFNSIGKSSDLRKMSCSHGEVPKESLIIDENKDQISDLIYWMLSSGSGPSTVDDEGVAGKPTVDAGGSSACVKHDKYQSCSPSRGAFGSFAYYDSEPNSTSNRLSLEMDPVWRSNNFTTVTTSCSSGKTYKWTVHVKAKTTWKKVQEKICEITTTGIDGIVYSPDEITFSGPTVVRFVSNSKSISNHAYGTAIDVNHATTYTVNGKDYKPYQRSLKVYNDFVAALGNENDIRNVNYVLWVKIFKPLGFTWGRYWGESSYDGMHFEIDYSKT